MAVSCQSDNEGIPNPTENPNPDPGGGNGENKHGKRINGSTGNS